MESAFRYALLTLYEVNQAICTADPAGRSRQHTILEVPALLVDTAFRRSLVAQVSDPVITSWWSGYYDLLDRRLQIEVANPVQTKIQRFAGSRAARAIVGQPCSTIDPYAWLRTGAIVIMNTAKGEVGEDTAGLIGATLLNLVSLATAEQASLDAAERRSVTLLVDEFHTMPGADYEGILGELAKYGANLILATQSLSRLETLDREHHRGLRGAVFANLDGLFAFHTSAEDARYLVRELGEGVDEQDLIALGEHQCYVRLSAGGERLPTFSVRLDPPLDTDPAVASQLAAASAAMYGRHWTAVEEDLRSALAQIEQAKRTLQDQSQPGQGGAGIARGTEATTENPDPEDPAAGKRNRSDNRAGKRPGPDVHQGTLFQPEGMSEETADAGPPSDETGPPSEEERKRGDRGTNEHGELA